jgi:Predicted 3''-5'' exonuclease related to the exonuclease domain of PolB
MSTTLVFAIETVPDVEGFSRLHDLDTAHLPQAEIAEMALLSRRQASGSDVMPLHLHRVVAIACVLKSAEGLKAWSLGQADSSEAELIQHFYDLIEHASPQLVSWNGSGFDLPVLHYRGLIHGVTAARYWDAGVVDPALQANPHPGQPLRPLDLMAVFALRQPHATAPLDQVARLCGFPGKPGMTGAKVSAAFAQGQIAAIRNDCETGAMNAWLVYLRFQKMRGALDAPAYRAQIELARSTVGASSAAHWQAFVAAWA